MKAARHFFISVLTLAAPTLGLCLAVGGNSAIAEAQALPALSRLSIVSADGRERVFRVELAQTEKQHLRGLMYRQSLPEDGGMLFDYGSEREIAMWMKNTFIPLDMLFIDKAGVIRHIHENAIPHDETAIPSGGPVRAVLELKGGVVAKLGIREGDRILSPVFSGRE